MPITDPEFFSVPIRTNIEVIPGDEHSIDVHIYDRIIITSKGQIEELPRIKPFILGWTVRESIGMAVVNARGVSKARKSVIIGE